MDSWEYEYFLDEKTRIVVKATKTKDPDFKDGLKFAVSFLHFKEEWKCISRIDNHLHKGKKGLYHIHRINEKQVQYKDINLGEAEEMIIRIGNNLIR